MAAEPRSPRRGPGPGRGPGRGTVSGNGQCASSSLPLSGTWDQPGFPGADRAPSPGASEARTASCSFCCRGLVCGPSCHRRGPCVSPGVGTSRWPWPESPRPLPSLRQPAARGQPRGSPQHGGGCACRSRIPRQVRRHFAAPAPSVPSGVNGLVLKSNSVHLANVATCFQICSFSSLRPAAILRVTPGNKLSLRT